MSRYHPDEWIAVVHPTPPHLVKVETRDRVVFDGFMGQLENARLAAASREMLAALKLFLEQYDIAGDPHRSARPELAAGRAAVAKAEGRAEE